MGLNPAPTFRSIKDKLESLVEYPVYVAEIPPDKSLKYDSKGTMKPFVVVYFGGPIRSARGRGIVSARNDPTTLFITVEAYAGSALDAIDIKGMLIDDLVEWKPEGASGLLPMGGMTYSRASNNVRPTMYIEATSFQCFSNLEV